MAEVSASYVSGTSDWGEGASAEDLHRTSASEEHRASVSASYLASIEEEGFESSLALLSAEQASKAEEQNASQKEQEADFWPQPLHVRYLCKAEKRRTANELAHEGEKLIKLQKSLRAESDAGKREEIQREIDRLQYQMRVRQLRLARLGHLNPQTHAELPAQLIAAARDGDADYMRLAYEANVNLDVQDEEMLITPLIAATIANKVSVVTALLELRADPRIQDINGATCILYSIQLDHFHALAAMLDASPADCFDALTIKDSRQLSAIDYARRPEREACLRLLQNRMGGPVAVVWQVFKGWLTDSMGISRQGKDRTKCCSACQTVIAAKSEARVATGKRP